MKLSDHLLELKCAFEALLQTSCDDLQPQPVSIYHGGRVRPDLPISRPRSTIPIIAPTFDPYSHCSTAENQLMLSKLAAFEVTYHDMITPISPDMAPIIIDSGASVTISPYLTDFLSWLHPVQ
jgi:hypothetical protein